MQPLSINTIVLCVNLALTSSLCMLLALLASWLFTSLPKRHVMLVAGLAGASVAPLLVLLAWWFGLAQLPIPIRSMNVTTALAPSDATKSNLDSRFELKTQRLLSATNTDDHVSDFNSERVAGSLSRIDRDPFKSTLENRFVSTPPGDALAASPESDGSTRAESYQNNETITRLAPYAQSIVPWIASLGIVVWLVGVAVVMLHTIRAWIACQQLLQKCQPVRSSNILSVLERARVQVGLNRCPSVLTFPGSTHADLVAPVVVGLLRPHILLPPGIESLYTNEQLHSALAHELMHVARRDHLTLGLTCIVQGLYWWNPLTYLMARRISETREMICDDVAARVTSNDMEDSPREYAAMIIQMAERVVVGANGWAPLGISESSTSELKLRIERLLSSGQRLVEVGTTFRFRAVLLACVALTLAGTVVTQLRIPIESTATAGLPAPGDTPESTLTKANQQPEETRSDDKHTLTLKIVDPEGKPVPKARIEVSDTRFQEEWVVVGTNAGRRGLCGLVDANLEGVVTLSLPSEVKPEVTIITEGFGPYWASWKNNPLPNELVVELDRAITIGGIVVDETGQPVAGALINPSLAFKYRPGYAGFDMHMGLRATTDADGRWEYANIPVHLPSIPLAVTHPKFKPTSLVVSCSLYSMNGQSEQLQPIVLEKGLTVRGRVRDANGQAIEGAAIRMQAYNELREARTDGAGNYELGGCESGVTKLVVSAPGKAMDYRKVNIAEAMESVDFVMQPGGHVRIRVVDEEGNPLPKSRVFFQSWKGEHINYFEFDHVDQYADETGTWEWNEAPLDEFTADICAPQRMQLSNQAIKARPEEYVFSPPPTLRIVGKVIDAKTRQPIDEFRVVPGGRSDAAYMNWYLGEAFEAKNGQFDYATTDGAFKHLIEVQAKGYLPKTSRDLDSDEGTVKILFELEPGIDIDMRVMTPHGLPAVGATVALGIPNSQISVNNGVIDTDSTYAEHTVVNEAGRFRFPPQATSYQLMIVHPEGFAHVDSEKLEHPDLIRLTPWSRVQGTFRVQGKPVPNARLYLNSGSFDSFAPERSRIFTSSYVVTDADGKFSLDRVFPGRGVIQREVVQVHNQGAKEVISAKSQPANFAAGETTSVEFSGEGAVLSGKLQLAKEAEGEVLWTFSNIFLQPSHSPPDPPFPAEFNDDLDARGRWFQQWRTTDAGQEWIALAEAMQAEAQKMSTYTATVAADGTFSIVDVEPGEYLLSAMFWDGSRSERLNALNVLVPSEVATQNETIDLGTLRME